MRGAGWKVLAAIVVAAPAAAEPSHIGPPALRRPLLRPHLGAVRPSRRRRLGIGPLRGGREIGPNVPPFLLAPPPPDTFLQPEGPGTSPLIEGGSSDLPALAHGFHLDVKVGTGQGFAAPPLLDRFVEVGQALGRCFPPPDGIGWGSITLRVAFKRDGTVFGLPRVPYSDAASAEQKSDLAHSLLAGLKRCTPLPLSSALGAAVAGEIFAIRFIHEDKR